MRNVKYDTRDLWQKDRDHYIHPWTDFATFKETGSDVIAEGEGVYMFSTATAGAISTASAGYGASTSAMAARRWRSAWRSRPGASATIPPSPT
jgi:hypothetical protein